MRRKVVENVELFNHYRRTFSFISFCKYKHNSQSEWSYKSINKETNKTIKDSRQMKGKGKMYKKGVDDI